MSQKVRTSAPPAGMFRQLRILVLLLVLLAVALSTCQESYRSTRWLEPLFVAIYPIAADESPVTRAYVAGMDAERFKPIDQFFMREALRYRLHLDEPVRTRLRTALNEHPPQREANAGVLATALWSLRLRYWAWRVSGRVPEPEDIRLFVLFHDPAITPSVPHSLGLRKGLIGVVYAFAAPEMNGANNMVMAHELLPHAGRHRQVRSRERCTEIPRRLRRPAAGASVPAAVRGIDGGPKNDLAHPLGAAGRSERLRHRSRHGVGDTLAAACS